MTYYMHLNNLSHIVFNICHQPWDSGTQLKNIPWGTNWSGKTSDEWGPEQVSLKTENSVSKLLVQNSLSLMYISSISDTWSLWRTWTGKALKFGTTGMSFTVCELPEPYQHIVECNNSAQVPVNLLTHAFTLTRIQKIERLNYKW